MSGLSEVHMQKSALVNELSIADSKIMNNEDVSLMSFIEI